VIQREQIKKGLSVQLLSDHLDVPQGTRATVDDIGLYGGQWWFTVRFHAYQPLIPAWSDPRRRRSARFDVTSLRLSEGDLATFELLNESEVKLAPSIVRPPVTLKLLSGWRKRLGRNTSVHPNQLSLFLADDF
jgi:hypothetical protein